MYPAIIIAASVLLAAFAALARHSPRGEEDAEGFHPTERVAVQQTSHTPKWIHFVFRCLGFVRTKTRH